MTSRLRLFTIGGGVLLLALVGVGLFVASRDAASDVSSSSPVASTDTARPVAADGGADSGRAATPEAGSGSGAETAGVAAEAAGAAGATAATATSIAPAESAPSSSSSAQSVLAEVVNQTPPVTVQVLAAKHITPDTLRVELALINRSAERAAFNATPADICLVTADGSRRLFALHDADNKPVGGGNFGPLAPNERRLVSVVFPAPPAGDTHAALLVGASFTLPNVPIS